MKKIKSSIILFSIFTSLLIAGCSNSSNQSSGSAKANGKESNTIRMAIDTAAGGSLQFRQAEKKGFFKQQNVDAKLSNFAMGVDTINAVLTEQADTGIAADYVAINSLAKGDLVVVATLTRGNEKTQKANQLLATGNIKSAADLKGKKIGVNKGTVNEYVWAQYLKAHDLSEKDVTYVPYSTPDEAIVGVKKGDIDAVWVSGALLEKFKSISGVHQIDDLTGAGVTIDSYLLAKKSLVEENPKAVENALKALNEGVQYVQNHKEDTAKLAFEQLKLPEDGVLKDLDRNNYVLGFTKEDAAHLEEMKQWMEDKGILSKSFNLDDKLSLDPLKKALPESVNY
ncbi:ABC transporter substrate-binding protein [Neobacillus cucumis]|uniref:ABC transporter substrate-binding protein n=1 Tax=Neobacillus cucumis TaxID=1740721 RepID=UPI0028535F00|nr:ABC transporter substrate-binding protein [Neobacillus cucumis]MDR4945420.1 ABC transporter substrate-binding protein [Neobacillus cucumis]